MAWPLLAKAARLSPEVIHSKFLQPQYHRPALWKDVLPGDSGRARVRARSHLSDSAHGQRDRVNVLCMSHVWCCVCSDADAHVCLVACACVCFSVCRETTPLQPEPSQLTFRLAFLPLFLAALPASGLLAAQEKEKALHLPG